MSDQPKGLKYHLLKCPLCEGRGELPQKEMLDRLGAGEVPGTTVQGVPAHKAGAMELRLELVPV